MSLIIQKTSAVIDLEKIHSGDLVYVNKSGWQEARKGIIIGVSEEKVMIQFKLGEGGATSHSTITAEELNSGTMEFRWSSDLLEIHSLEEDGEADAT